MTAGLTTWNTCRWLWFQNCIVSRFCPFACYRLWFLEGDLDKCVSWCTSVLTELFSPVSESALRGHLHSAAHGDLVVPRCRTTRYDQICFAGPILWNSLPLSVHDPSLTPIQFCVLSMTMLFCSAYDPLAVHCCDSFGCKDRCPNTLFG